MTRFLLLLCAAFLLAGCGAKGVTYIDDLTPFQEAVAGVYDKYKQTDLKPYIEALEAAKAKVGE